MRIQETGKKTDHPSHRGIERFTVDRAGFRDGSHFGRVGENLVATARNAGHVPLATIPFGAVGRLELVFCDGGLIIKRPHQGSQFSRTAQLDQAIFLVHNIQYGLVAKRKNLAEGPGKFGLHLGWTDSAKCGFQTTVMSTLATDPAPLPVAA